MQDVFQLTAEEIKFRDRHFAKARKKERRPHRIIPGWYVVYIDQKFKEISYNDDTRMWEISDWGDLAFASYHTFKDAKIGLGI